MTKQTTKSQGAYLVLVLWHTTHNSRHNVQVSQGLIQLSWTSEFIFSVKHLLGSQELTKCNK